MKYFNYDEMCSLNDGITYTFLYMHDYLNEQLTAEKINITKPYIPYPLQRIIGDWFDHQLDPIFDASFLIEDELRKEINVHSNIGDYWRNEFPKKHPDWIKPNGPDPLYPTPITYPTPVISSTVTREEFEEVKYEMEDKIDLIRKVCKLVNVDISDVFPEQVK